MKYLLITLMVTCMFSFWGFSQEFTYPLNTTSSLLISIDVSNTRLEIVGHDKNEIVIKYLGGAEVPDERAAGLEIVTAEKDNTGLGLFIKEEKDIVRIIKQNIHKKAYYIMQVPSTVSIEIRETGWQGMEFRLSGINGNVSVIASHSNIFVNNMGGKIHAKTVSGSVYAELGSWPELIKHELSTVSGPVEIIIDKDARNSLKLNTISGVIITDFDIAQTIKYKGATLIRVGRIKKAIKLLNGGGGWLEASSVSGSIKIRLQ